MSRAKIYSHIIMWTVIFSGALLGFLFFPQKYLFSIKSEVKIIIAIPLAVVMLNCFFKSLMLHLRLKASERKEESLIRSGVYGRFEHPTCTCLVFFFWIIFLFFPDARLFVANIWMTIVVIMFLEIEKSVYWNNKEKKEEEASV